MIKKSAAILISLSLLCSAAFSDIAVQNAAQNGAFQANALPLIPNDLGKVINVSRFDGGAFSVINIQDLHCHAEVQKNIASIIEILQKNGNIAAVFTEGGYGKIDLSVYGAIKDADLKETFIENLLSQGRLTGSEYFALKRNLETPLYGLDEQETHLLNLERLAEITLKEERYLQVLSKVKSEIEYLQNKYLSKENKKLNKLVEKHRQGEISSRKYYALLCKYIEKVNAAGERYNPLLTVSLSKYPAFENYITLLKLSDQINYDKASREIQALLGNLKNVLTYAQYQKLSSDTNGFNDIYALSALLEEVFAQQGMAIKSANLEKLIDYSKKSAKFNPVKLIDEESAVIEDLRLAFSNGGDEVEISFLSDFEPSLEGFFKTTITAQELKFFEKNYDKFLQIYNKHAYKNELAVLDDDLAFLRQYHKTNEDRNNIFVKNIENVMRSFPGKTAIAVSGGFHSDALAELFKDKRISCITVMPKITKETKTAREKYSEILLSIHPTAVQSKELSNQAFAPQEFSTQSLALSLISQTDSHSFARVLLDSVFSNLKDMDFTEENFNKIADAIEALAGVSPTINYDGNYAKILFNENEFLFYKDGKGKIDEDSKRVIKKFNKVYKNESKKLETERLEEIFANSLSLANYMQTAVFTPNVSQIVKKGAQIAAQNGLTSGDMIFDIEMDETLPQIIDGVDRDLIRKMPDAAQRVILKSYERDSFFSDAQRTIYAKAVYAAYSALNADKAVLDSFLENRRTGFTQKTSSEAPDEVIAKELGVSEIKHYDIKDNFDDIALDALSGKAIALTFKRDASETDDKTYYNRVVNNMELLSKALLENKFDISKFIGQYNSPQTALYEMLKNAFVHGNHLDGNLSVYIRIDEEKGEVKVLNKKHDTPYSDFAESPQFYDTLPDLHGYSMAQLVSSQNFYLIYTHSDPSDEFYIEQFTLNEDYIIRRRPTADDKPYNSLTLESSYDIADKIIDKLPVKNESFQYFVWNAVISIVEFLPSALLPHKMFVAAHYPEFVERLSNKTMAGFLREYREIKKEMAKNPGKYGLRLQGAKRIKIATTLGAFAGISAAIITSAALPIAIIAAIALSFIFNIATHADYNQRIDDNGLGFSSHRLTVGEEEYHGSIINIDELIGGDGQNIYLAEYSDGTISEVSAGEYNAYWRLAERMARQTLTPKRRETAQAAQSLTSVQKGLAYKEASAKIYAIGRARAPYYEKILLENGRTLELEKFFKDGEGYFTSKISDADGKKLAGIERKFYSRFDLKGEMRSLKQFASATLSAAYKGYPNTSSSLTLLNTEKLVDKLGVKNKILRNVLISFIELPFVLLPANIFVALHYEDLTPEIIASKEYRERTNGAAAIFKSTFAGFVLAGLSVAIFTSISYLAVAAIAVGAGVLANVIAHTVYNLIHIGNELILGYRDINYGGYGKRHIAYLKDKKAYNESYSASREFLRKLKTDATPERAWLLQELENLGLSLPVSIDIKLGEKNISAAIDEIIEIMFDFEKQTPGFINVLYKNDEERKQALISVIKYLKDYDKFSNISSQIPIFAENGEIKYAIEQAFFAPSDTKINALSAQEARLKNFSEDKKVLLTKIYKISEYFGNDEKKAIAYKTSNRGKIKEIEKILETSVIFDASSKKEFLDIVSLAIKKGETGFIASLEQYLGESLDEEFKKIIKEIIFPIIGVGEAYLKKNQINDIRTKILDDKKIIFDALYGDVGSSDAFTLLQKMDRGKYDKIISVVSALDDKAIEDIKNSAGNGEIVAGVLKSLKGVENIISSKENENLMKSLGKFLYEADKLRSSDIIKELKWALSDEGKKVNTMEFLLSKSEMKIDTDDVEKAGITEDDILEVYSKIAQTPNVFNEVKSAEDFKAFLPKKFRKGKKLAFMQIIFMNFAKLKPFSSDGLQNGGAYLQSAIENAMHFFSEDVSDIKSEQEKISARIFSERKYKNQDVIERFKEQAETNESAFVVPVIDETDKKTTAYYYITVNREQKQVDILWLRPNGAGEIIRLAGFAPDFKSVSDVQELCEDFKKYILYYSDNAEFNLIDFIIKFKNILDNLSINTESTEENTFGKNQTNKTDNGVNIFINYMTYILKKILSEKFPGYTAEKIISEIDKDSKISDEDKSKIIRIINFVLPKEVDPYSKYAAVNNRDYAPQRTGTYGLTLKSSKNIVDKLGINNKILRNVIVSFLELPFTFSINKFADKHYEEITDEIKTSQDYQTRLGGARNILFSTLFGLTIGIAISSTLLMPPLAIASIGIVTGILGNISVHTIYNLIHGEGKTKMNSEELDAMFRRYRGMSNDIVVSELRKEIDGFLSDVQAIKEVILHPERYADGQQLREDYLWNIGLFYERSVLNKGFDVSDKIFDLILYDIYKDADTSHLQYFYMKHLIAVDNSAEEIKAKMLKENRLLDIIELNYRRDLARIKEIDTAYKGKQNEKLLKLNKMISELVIPYADMARGFTKSGQFYSDSLLEEIVDKKTYGHVAAQIFENEYAIIKRTFSFAPLDRFLDAKQKRNYYNFLKTTKAINEVLKHIISEHLPYEIGTYSIFRKTQIEVLYSTIKSKDIDPRFRLYALKVLSSRGQTEADIMFDKDNSDFVTKAMFKMVSTALNKEAFKAESERLKEAKEKYEIKTLFTEEELKEMAEIADRIISDKKFISDKNPYSSSIAAEILMTALIVKAAYYSAKEDKFDIIAALRELPFVLSFSSNNSYKDVELTSGEGSHVIFLQDAGVELRYRIMQKYIEIIEYPISQATKTASGAYRIIDALKNDEVIKNAARDYEISADGKVVRLNPNSSKLSLPKTDAFVDKLGITNKIFRTVIMSLLELPHSMLYNKFVDMHYENVTPEVMLSKEYETRTKGAIAILTSTMLGFSVAGFLAAASTSLPFFAVAAIAAGAGVLANVIAHTVYNLTHSEAKLMLGSDISKDETLELARPIEEQIKNFTQDKYSSVKTIYLSENEILTLRRFYTTEQDKDGEYTAGYFEASIGNKKISSRFYSDIGSVDSADSFTARVSEMIFPELYSDKGTFAPSTQNEITNFIKGAAKKMVGVPVLMSGKIRADNYTAAQADIGLRFFEGRVNLQGLAAMSKEQIKAASDVEITMPAVLINELPVNPKEAGFINTGIKTSSGQTLWVSVKTGTFVLFVNGAREGEVEKSLPEENKKIARALSELLKKAGVENLPAKININWSFIDYAAKKTAFSYDENGRAKLAIAVQDIEIQDRLPDFIAAANDIQRAQRQAQVQNIYYFFDNLLDAKDFEEKLGEFKSIGNGQIILNYETLKAMFKNEADIKKFLDAARASGLKVIADFTDAQEDKQKAQEMSRKEQLKQIFKSYLNRFRQGNLSYKEDVNIGEMPQWYRNFGLYGRVITDLDALAKIRDKHQQSWQVIENIMDYIENPLALFESYYNSIVVLTDFTTRNNENQIGFEGIILRAQKDGTFLASMYTFAYADVKKNISGLLAVNKNKIAEANKVERDETLPILTLLQEQEVKLGDVNNITELAQKGKSSLKETPEQNADIEKIKEIGFDGYIYKSKGKLLIRDFYLNNETQADMVEGYANVSALEKKLSQNSGIKIIRDTEITNLYKNFRKDSLMEKSVIKRFLLGGSGLLNLISKADMYSDESIINTVYAIKTTPEFSAQEVDAIKTALKDKNYKFLEEIIAADRAGAFSAFLTQIETNISQDEIEIKKEILLKAAAEKVLVKYGVAGTLVNRDYEKTLGKALRIAAQEAIVSENNGQYLYADALQAKIKSMQGLKEYEKYDYKTLKEIALNEELKKLTEKAFAQKAEPQALNALIELIPAFADTKVKVEIKDNMVQFEIKAITSILSAA